MIDNKHQRRDDQRAGGELEWEGVSPPAVRTWRERIGVGPSFPLHAPNDVERAMEAEIAELRARLALAEQALAAVGKAHA